MLKNEALDSTLSKALKKEVVAHKERFTQIYKGKLLEELPSLIGYSGAEDTSIDVLYTQYLLRNNYTVVIGELRDGSLGLLGTLNSGYKTSQNNYLLSMDFNKRDIKFIAPRSVRKEEYNALTYYNTTGNCVAISNKLISYIDDRVVINHYVKELAEICISRYSLSIQARFLTFINTEDPSSQDVNNLVSAIYNGEPFPIVDSNISVMNELIKVFENTAFSSNSPELKSEFQNKLAELNHLIGVQSLSVEKKSGVSNDEARGNKSSTIGFGNVYLKSQQMSLNLLNKRFNKNLKAMYYSDLESDENAHYEGLENDTIELQNEVGE